MLTFRINMSSCSTAKPKLTQVVSKYFNDCEAGMDESLTEFQEPKKNIRGPKSNNRTKAAAKPRKKVQKKVKGQKDIKTAFQKNDIIGFTEDFNRICAQSGIDVDAEQLQIAIALSKSLQNSKNENNVVNDDTVPTTSQQRSGKVRSTLLEYGFKVPEVKIDCKSSRRLKKYKKISLLLLQSNEEKQQNIADRYSQIIFDSLGTAHENDDDNKDFDEFSPIYDKATKTTYREMRNNEYFYIENLIEVSTEPIGSLLRDWSAIPGRPKSPISKPNKSIQVSKLLFSETEINILLSGKLIDAQKIVSEKSETIVSETQTVKDDQNAACHLKINAEHHDVEEESLANDFMNESNKHHDLRHRGMFKDLAIRVRSPSPDLFDDDISVEIAEDVNGEEYINKSELLSNTKVGSNYPNMYNIVMDLTQSMNERSSSGGLTERKILNVEDIVVSDETSNEPMKYPNGTPTVQNNSTNEKEIDLTQSPDLENDVTILNNGQPNIGRYDNLVIMESSADEDDETLPYVELSGQKPRDIFNEQDSQSHVSKSQEPSLIILEDEDNDNKIERNETVITEKSSKSSRGSNFEEYSFNHSDDDNNLKRTIDLTNIESNTNTLINANRSPEIDLTQTYSSSEENGDGEIVQEAKVLEIHDNASVIYDDENPELQYHYDNNILDHNKTHYSILEPPGSPIQTKNTSSLSQNQLNSSQKTNTDAESEIFEISDEELNYSVHNSKFHLSQDNISEPDYESPNFDLGGISVINNLPSAQNSINKSKEVINESYEAKNKKVDSRNDSYLPAIEIAGIKSKLPKKLETPTIKFNVEQGPTNQIAMNTPKNSGFIVKTSEVTPIVDYASLTTPERNKELDKYGLKPFKRKRAIQLLTHLYNQTHPIVEVPIESDTASPAKRRKPEPANPTSSARKPLTPRKSPILPGSSSSGANSDVQYEITNFPILKDIECCPEDWVFQKREKAKLHSCRVPLHVAFHNLVSSSQHLRESILRYEPVNIEVIHRDLVAYGHRYDPKDLLKYLDKKCITVKTADNSSRNEKKSRLKL